jgi:hypothetical protein
MSREIRAFAPTIPACTPQSAPVAFSLAMPARIVDQIDIRVPPGPNGLMGFQITSANQPIIPYNAGAFVIANDERIIWALTNQITSGAWQLMGYNTGQYDHTVYVRFLLSLTGTSAPDPTGSPIDAALIDSGGSLSGDTTPDTPAAATVPELAPVGNIGSIGAGFETGL